MESISGDDPPRMSRFLKHRHRKHELVQIVREIPEIHERELERIFADRVGTRSRKIFQALVEECGREGVFRFSRDGNRKIIAYVEPQFRAPEFATENEIAIANLPQLEDFFFRSHKRILEVFRSKSGAVEGPLLRYQEATTLAYFLMARFQEYSAARLLSKLTKPDDLPTLEGRARALGRPLQEAWDPETWVPWLVALGHGNKQAVMEGCFRAAELRPLDSEEYPQVGEVLLKVFKICNLRDSPLAVLWTTS